MSLTSRIDTENYPDPVEHSEGLSGDLAVFEATPEFDDKGMQAREK